MSRLYTRDYTDLIGFQFNFQLLMIIFSRGQCLFAILLFYFLSRDFFAVSCSIAYGLLAVIKLRWKNERYDIKMEIERLFLRIRFLLSQLTTNMWHGFHSWALDWRYFRCFIFNSFHPAFISMFRNSQKNPKNSMTAP